MFSVICCALLAAWIFPSAMAGEIHEAVKKRDTKRVSQMLARLPGIVNETTDRGSTPLHFAAGLGDSVMCSLLISKGANVNAETSKGFTPLHWAAYMDQEEAARVLLAKGANTQIKNEDGATPFNLAVRQGATSVARLLTKNTSSPYKETLIDPRMKSAADAQRSGDLRKAYELYIDLLRKDPGNERVNFALGMTCLSLKDYSRATLAFQRVLRLNPRNSRARLELAYALMMNNQTAQAESEFRKVLRSNPPENVARRINMYLNRMQKGGSLKVMFGGSVRAGYEYKDNVNSGPAFDNVEIQTFYQDVGVFYEVPEEGRPTADDGYFCEATGMMIYDAGERDGWVLNGTLYFAGSWWSDMDDYATQLGLVDVTPRRSLGNGVISISSSIATLHLGGDPLMTLYGLNPSYMYRLSGIDDVTWVTSGGVSLHAYDELTSRDAIFSSVKQSLKHSFGRGHSISMGVRLFDSNADAGIYSNKGADWDVRLEVKPGWDVYLSAGLSYSVSRYEEQESWATQKRKDERTVFDIGATKKIAAGLGVGVWQKWEDRISSVTLYQNNYSSTRAGAFLSF